MHLERIAITEKQFGTQVENLFSLFGWEFHHVVEQYHYARRTTKGFPDYVAIKQNDDGTVRLLFIEIKSEKGKLSKNQARWLWLLRKCSETYIWRPSMLEKLAHVLR